MPESMNSSWTDDELWRAVQETLRRVSIDSDFKKLALSDGAGAVARVNPKPLPTGLVLKFVDNSGPLKVIPLPAPSFESEEITEAELEAVAGGSVNGSINVNCGIVGGSIGVST